MAYCMTFSSYFLHKIHIAKIKTNSALFLDHYNLKGWPRLGVDGGKESWFRADVLFLCNLSFKYQRKISESLRPKTVPLRVCCFVFFFFFGQSSSFLQQPHPHSRPQEKRQLWTLANEKSLRESSSELGVNLPSALAAGLPAERSYLLHSPASVHLHSFKTTFHWGPKERYSRALERDCGMSVTVSRPLPWVLDTVWVLKNASWISGDDHSTFWFWLN